MLQTRKFHLLKWMFDFLKISIYNSFVYFINSFGGVFCCCLFCGFITADAALITAAKLPIDAIKYITIKYSI